MYKQEMWIQKYFNELNVPVCFGNGGALDFVAGKRRRAPKWMIRMGLKWLFRLIQEPSRMTPDAFTSVCVYSDGSTKRIFDKSQKLTKDKGVIDYSGSLSCVNRKGPFDGVD
jgi:hypothetical protein